MSRQSKQSKNALIPDEITDTEDTNGEDRE